MTLPIVERLDVRPLLCVGEHGASTVPFDLPAGWTLQESFLGLSVLTGDGAWEARVEALVDEEHGAPISLTVGSVPIDGPGDRLAAAAPDPPAVPRPIRLRVRVVPVHGGGSGHCTLRALDLVHLGGGAPASPEADPADGPHRSHSPQPFRHQEGF